MRTSGLRRCAPALPFIRWCGNTLRLAARSPVARWPRGRGWERPPSPRAWYGFGGRCVCAPLPPPLGVAPRPTIPGGKAVQSPFGELGCAPTAKPVAAGNAHGGSERNIAAYLEEHDVRTAGNATARRMKPGFEQEAVRGCPGLQESRAWHGPCGWYGAIGAKTASGPLASQSTPTRFRRILLVRSLAYGTKKIPVNLLMIPCSKTDLGFENALYPTYPPL